MSETKVLVTGHRGQLGSDLMEGLSASFDITGVDIDMLDITDKSAVMEFIEKLQPDIVIHAAAYTNVDGCETNAELAMGVNRDGTSNVAEACRNIGAYMIYYSTDYVFDGQADAPYVETDSPNPQTVYGRSKLAGEEAVRKMLDDYAILRIAWVYGKSGKNFVKTMVRLAQIQQETKRRGETVKPLTVVDDQIGNPTWTMDIVRQTQTVIDRRLKGLYHSTSEGQCSWYRFASDIFEIVGFDVDLQACSTAEFPRPAKRPAMSVLENRRLNEADANVMRHYRMALEEFLTTNEGLIS
ncbi:MAG: dTDP-4-dehydrorhamnose reductase [Candidatus Zixiibacteriota bacterium]